MRESDYRRTAGSIGPIATAAVIIYATLGLMLLMIPQSLSNWAKDHDLVLARVLLMPLANRIETASNMIWATYPYLYLRQKYLSATGKNELD
jgi:hypothetical protein